MPKGYEFDPKHGYQFLRHGQEVTTSRHNWAEERKRLKQQPKSVLLKIAIELDPEVVAETYEEGWTKEDIIEVIKKHVRESLGSQHISGWQYIQDVDVVDIEEIQS